MSSNANTPQKEYKLALDDEKVTDPLLAETIQVMRTPTVSERVLNHPALPVASYCVASIMMTVVNKVSNQSGPSGHQAKRTGGAPLIAGHSADQKLTTFRSSSCLARTST